MKDPRVDAYIAKAAPFARPILERIRRQVHENVPEVKETIKWSFPFFDYHGLFCMMTAFKQHCGFGFWRDIPLLDDKEDSSIGQLGRITSVDDLPSEKQFAALLKKAVAIRNQPKKATPTPRRTPRPVPKMPADFGTALAKNTKAKKNFEAFPPSHKREYLEWILDAKRDETRQRRLATAVAQIADGKSLNWKYQ